MPYEPALPGMPPISPAPPSDLALVEPAADPGEKVADCGNPAWLFAPTRLKTAGLVAPNCGVAALWVEPGFADMPCGPFGREEPVGAVAGLADLGIALTACG